MVLLATLTLAGAATGCVSRNVESIGDEEAAAIAPPPPPVARERPGVPDPATQGLTGTIDVGEGVVPPPGVIYVIVRVSGREGGPPLAVKQLASDFPVQFSVTEADAMIPGTPLVGDLDVVARLDQDGDAFSRQPGDLEGRVGPVQVGAVLTIVLEPGEGPVGAASP